MGGSDDLAGAKLFVVYCDGFPSEARGSLQTPDEEIGKGAYFLAYQVLRVPLWPGRPYRSFDLVAELGCESCAVLLGRRHAGRQGKSGNLSTD